MLFASLPWIRKSTHRRIYIEQGEAYRREIQEARWAQQQAERKLQQYVDALGGRALVDRSFQTGDYRISFEISRHIIEGQPPQTLVRLVSENIMRRILDAQRDYRGDMRQTPTQRALGL